MTLEGLAGLVILAAAMSVFFFGKKGMGMGNLLLSIGILAAGIYLFNLLFPHWSYDLFGWPSQ